MALGTLNRNMSPTAAPGTYAGPWPSGVGVGANPTLAPMGGFMNTANGQPLYNSPQALSAAINANYGAQGSSSTVTPGQTQPYFNTPGSPYYQPPTSPTAPPSVPRGTTQPPGIASIVNQIQNSPNGVIPGNAPAPLMPNNGLNIPRSSGGPANPIAENNALSVLGPPSASNQPVASPLNIFGPPSAGITSPDAGAMDQRPPAGSATALPPGPVPPQGAIPASLTGQTPTQAPPSGTLNSPDAGPMGQTAGPGLYAPGYNGTPPYPGTGAAGTPPTGATTSPFPYSSTAAATSALTPTNTFNPTAGKLPNPTFPSANVPGFPGPSDQNLAPELEAAKQMNYTQGNQILNQFQGQNTAAQDTSNQLQKAYLGSIAPLLAGQGGYTTAQQNAIMDQTGPFGLNTLDPNANIAAFQEGAGNVNAALDTGQGAVNKSLTQGAADVNAAIDPNALRISPEFQQDLVNQAAFGARTAAQAQEQGIQNQAFASGNVSPLAIAAAQNEAAQQGDIAASQAVTNARVQGEQARVAAEQQAENIQTQNQQELAQRNTGAQLQQEATGVGAQQGIMTSGQAATQAQQTQGMDLNQLESGRSQTVANANLQAGQEGRADLSNQQQQNQQTALTAGQQELGTFGTTAGATNQAGQLQITNKAANANNSPVNLLLGGAEKGGVFKGPIVAEVGEHPNPHSPTGYDPEAIVPIGPEKMQSGGLVGLRRSTIKPPAPAAVKLPRFGEPKFGVPKGHYGIPPSSLERTMTRSGFQRTIPQFDTGGVADPNAGLNDSDSPGMWGPTKWQQVLAAVGAMSPRLGGVIGAIPGATWQDPSKPPVPEWQKVLGAVNPKVGRAVGAVRNAVSSPTAAPAPPPKAPVDPGATQQKAFWQAQQPNFWKDPTIPKINDVMGFGGGSNKPTLNIPTGTPPSSGGGFPPSGGVGGPTSTPTKTPPPSQNPIPVGMSTDPVPVPSVVFGPNGAPPTTPPTVPNVTFGPNGTPPAGPTAPPAKTTAPPTAPPSNVPPKQGTNVNTNITYPGFPGVNYPSPGTTDPGTGGQTQSPTTPPDYNISYGNNPPDAAPGGDPSTLPISGGPDPTLYGPGTFPTGNPTLGNMLNGPNMGPVYGNPSVNSGQTGGSGNPIEGDIGPVGTARGGVAIPRTRFGATEIVTRPQTRVLGATQPQAVVPLNGKKNNRVRPRDIPKLVSQYA